ncbi:MAG: family efflux transporter, subunit [Planctomycetota bacterium]|nr:family efflux transporter, subunit [Planctomycetota bacterium]
MLRRISVALCTTLGTLLLLIGCDRKNVLAELPPPIVTVTSPIRKSVTTYLEYTGITKSTASVELRARVKGFLKARYYDERKNSVQKDQPLFLIEEEPYRARVQLAEAKLQEALSALQKAETSKIREIAKAQLALDNAALLLARIEESRQRSLVARNAASAQDVDRAEANTKKAAAQVESDQAALEQAKSDYEVNIATAKANVAAARADLENAKIDLSYCRINAPISGRISRSLVDVGNLVGEGQATQLATIVADDPIYVYMSASESDLLRFRDMRAKGQRKDYREVELPLEMELANETGYVHKGIIQYVDPAVDPVTGTIQARGVFRNHDGKIVPGLFVRVRLPFEDKPNALLLPERALVAEVGLKPGERMVLVVGADNVAKSRVLRVGSAVDGLRIIEGGLKPDDRVIVDGIQKAREDEKVNPQPADPASFVTGTTPSGASSPAVANPAEKSATVTP